MNLNFVCIWVKVEGWDQIWVPNFFLFKFIRTHGTPCKLMMNYESDERTKKSKKMWKLSLWWCSRKQQECKQFINWRANHQSIPWPFTTWNSLFFVAVAHASVCALENFCQAYVLHLRASFHFNKKINKEFPTSTSTMHCLLPATPLASTIVH